MGGYANCGTDTKGREIGYAHEATCDHPGCTEKIDRGYSYACGGQHGEADYWCEGYFCWEHLVYMTNPTDPDDGQFVCHGCSEAEE